MGKVRNKKFSKIARSDPTGLDKVANNEELEGCAELGPVSAFVQTIMEQLKSHLTEERDSGLNSLSNASSKPLYLEEILSSDLFKVVGPLLLDPSVSVRHSAAGALRNLSSISMEVSEQLILADIMTPLVTLIKQKYSGDWVPLSKEKKSKFPFKIDSATEAFVEAVTLLWNLCEAGTSAIKMFNQEKLGDLLCRFLNVDTYGFRVAVCTALCLYSATEDNSDALTNQPQLEELLMRIFSVSEDNDTVNAWQFLYLKTATAGILVNLHKGDLSTASPNTTALIMKILNASLEIDHLSEMNKFSSEVPISNGNHQEVYHRETESDFKQIFELDEKLNSIMALTSSQVMALEILSNVITSEDEHWSDDEDEESVQDFEDEMETEDNQMKDAGISDIPSEVYESLSSAATVAKVLTKIKYLPVNVLQILNENETHGQKLLRKSNILRSTALICLQNLVEVMSLADLERSIGIGELWEGLGATLTSCTDSTDTTLIEAVTSAMRAVIQSIVNQKTVHSASVQLCSGISILHEVYEAVSECKVRVNVVKIIGSIALILTKHPKDKVINGSSTEILLTQITGYFLNCLSSLQLQKDGLWLAAEILDTLFDVFAEDDYNHVLKSLSFLAKLKVMQPTFKKQVRNERRSLGENAAVIQTANTNLPRFIQYKEKLGV